jgi:L-lactate dehydrogenase (cytochrome)
MRQDEPNPLPTFADLRAAARQRLPRVVFDFIDGAAGREVGLMRNTAIFDAVALMPRVLVDPPVGDLTVRLLGQELGLPFGCAPMGMCNLAGPGTDLALADAAARGRFPLGVSTAGSTAVEVLMERSQGRAWFQLYVNGSVDEALALADRAAAAQCEVLTLTVDTPRTGNRPRDTRNGFRTPFRMGLRHFVDFALHPRWSLGTLAAGAPRMVHFDGLRPGGYDRTAPRRGANWEFLARLRERWPRRLVVKGVLNPEDAQRLQALGVDALQVSNHGARQLDAALTPLGALPAIRAAVGPDFPLILDGGVRQGEDVVKALACGADFVMLGRPFLYAAAARGLPGVNALVDTLADDIRIALAQLGLASVVEVGPQVLAASALTAPRDILA